MSGYSFLQWVRGNFNCNSNGGAVTQDSKTNPERYILGIEKLPLRSQSSESWQRAERHFREAKTIGVQTP